ncbi:tyrosine-type recombinase/integrase [Neptuniibacter sp. QD37_6]|uniref:tyrosine-type recombinase/integrase n=1 Tax=Neptuniibacter sp. QD37_6 TaxID=3398210 RepID=UPI0039F4D259
MQSPNYMILRGKTYWFNYALPFSSTRLRLSLKSQCKDIAQAVAYRLSLRVSQYLEVVPPVQYSEAEIKTLARQWAEQLLNEVKEDALSSGMLKEKEQYEHWEQASFNVSEAREAVAYNNLDYSSRAADLFIEEHDLAVTKDSYEYNLLRSEMNTHSVQFFEYQRALYSKGEPLPETFFPDTTVVTPVLPKPIEIEPEPSPSITEVFEKCKEDKIRCGEWSTNKSINSYSAVIAVLLEIMGDKPISEFSKADVRDYKEQLPKYPKNRTKAKHLKNRTLEEITATGDYETISDQTAHNQFDKAKAVFNWAEREGYIDRSPFGDMTIKVNQRSKEARLPFSTEDLQAIFSQPVFTERKFTKNWHYWVPLIGLYTGARISEICQLKLDEVSPKDGIPAFHIIADEEGRRLKNAASRRIIPIHQQLIDYGLLGYVNQMKAKGETMLFPELEGYASESWGNEPSKWFGNLKKRIITKDANRKTFHSFRHGMTDKLRLQQVQSHIISQLLGHEQESTTHSTYGSEQIGVVQPALQQVDFSEVLEGVKPFYAEKS